MVEEVVKCVLEGAVAKLSINRPDKRNAISADVIDGFLKHLNGLALNQEIRVIEIRGEGPCFSAGIDMTYLAGLGGVDENLRGVFLRELARKVQSVMNRIESIEKPVVAVIHRHCIGLGMELALACDFRIAASDVILSLPEIYMGLVPDCGGTTRLTRIVGVAKAKELVMLGDPIGADEAKSLGLLTEVTAPADLRAAADKLIARLIERPSRALGLAKRLVDLSASVDEMTSFELETLAQTGAVAAPDFPQVLASGVQNLMKKK